MIKKLTIIFLLVLITIPVSHTYTTVIGTNSASSCISIRMDNYCEWFYKKLGNEIPKPAYDVFKKALTGYFNLKAESKIGNNLLTIIDFSLSSSKERMWIIDMVRMKITHRSLVSHGRNSGGEFAKTFSNRIASNQSSLGFYLTGGVYYGKNGFSLYLDGLEKGINDKARERTIVMHSADYVSKEFIRRYGRLGRSLGCPAIPVKNHREIIRSLSGRSCMFIYYPSPDYFGKSLMLNYENAFIPHMPFATRQGLR